MKTTEADESAAPATERIEIHIFEGIAATVPAGAPRVAVVRLRSRQDRRAEEAVERLDERVERLIAASPVAPLPPA